MAETRLDLRGLRCPYPVLRARKALQQIEIGGELVLECTDPMTVIDVPHFVSQTGHALVGQDRLDDLYVVRILRKR
jgi:tRNA 2-thiouridine synthesizing protein A